MVKIAGFSIQNYSSKLGGILLTEVSFCNISNNNFFKNKNGIYLKSSHHNLISNNIFIDNEENGVSVIKSTYNEIINNSFSNNSAGIYLSGSWQDESTYNVIKYNHCTNNTYGIHCIISNFNDIINNTCLDNFIGIFIEGRGDFYCLWNWLKNNICIFNSNSGIALSLSSYSTIEGNNCNNNLITGISLQDVDHNTIEKNMCINTNQGIVLNNKCSSNIVRNNFCLKNINGIITSDSTMNKLRNNVFSDNNIGIIIIGSNQNKISSNNVTMNHNGILIENSNDNTFSKNNCSSNDGYGIKFIESSKSNNISLNNISLNADYGVLLSKNSEQNIFYRNNFIDNYNQVDDYGQNNWDKFDEGNYWSDYTGSDNGAGNRLLRDGIGDTKIPHHGLDNYPFILLDGWFIPVAPLLHDPGAVDRNGEYLVSWITNQDVDGFILEEDDDINFKTPQRVYYGTNGSIQKFEITGKAEGTYYYRVKAYAGEYNSTWSKIRKITVNCNPPAVENLQVIAWPAGNALNISWDLVKTETKAKVVNYQLQMKTSGNWQDLANITHPKNKFNDTGLSNGIIYSYRLCVWDSQNRRSEFSSIVTGIPMDTIPPETPTVFWVTNKTHNSVYLKWTRSSSYDLKGYNIYRTRDTITNSSNYNWSEPLNDDTLLVENEYIDTGLEPGTTYYYAVTSVDFDENESPYSKILTVRTYLSSEYPQAPRVNNSPPDFSISEDGFDQTTINLYRWFYDINSDKLTFKYNSSNPKYINVKIFPENGTVELRPEKNWNGEEQLTFYVSDGVFEISDYVNVTITPVNDTPEGVVIYQPENGSRIKQGSPLMFKGNGTDADLFYGDELTFIWWSDRDGVLGTGTILSNVSLTPGQHKITLMVTDSSNLYDSAIINITVVHPIEPFEDHSGLIVVSLFVIIIIVVAIFIIIRYLRLSKENKE